VARAIDEDRFTIGVFQDAAWARRGVEALLRDGFTAAAITILAKDSPEAALLIESTLGAPAGRVEMKALGPVVACGPLVAALQGADNALESSGLVAIRSEPRAADALARLHAYGGGNAAIGAWTGRV
jgi:hypothetical protein